jgi:O-antigen/teichoic acid export membrane protein
MLFLVFIPQGIASILLGPSFRQAGADLMPIVATATFIQGLESFYFSFAFALSKKPLKQTYILIIAMIVNVILTIWLVPILGMRGGAWATLLSSIVALFGSIFIGSSLQKLPLALNELIRIALAAFPMTVILIWLAPDTPFHTILTGLLALSLYVLALFGLNVAGLRQILLRFLRLQFATLYSKGELK